MLSCQKTADLSTTAVLLTICKIIILRRRWKIS